ncbi:MAG: hypothetical protein L0Y76_01205, partial [Ignavibacteria bacterium]|nr:hypothetical protein [Ignavibacteria bacterium]
MKLKYFKLTALLVMIVLAASVYAKPRIKIGQQTPMNPDVVVQSIQLKANNIASWFHNTGVFNQDFRTT